MSPTISEVAEAVGLGSPNATRHHLEKLVAAGEIQMKPKIARSITLVQKAS
jgi:SOS-response transcriptional repressor LexA